MDTNTDTLSQAELDYFSSKGEKTEGLGVEPSQEPAGEPQAAEPTSEAGSEPKLKTGEIDDDEGIYVDADGKTRSVLTGKFVPHAALHKERERRKSVETDYHAMREQMARAQERLAVLNEVISASEAPAQAPKSNEPPDPEQDIFAYVKWQNEQLTELRQAKQQETEQAKARQMTQQVENLYRQDAMRFAQQTPDFSDAYQYVAQSYASELKALGYSDPQIHQRMIQEEGQLVVEALQRQLSPAQVIYERAKARGYTKKEAAPAAAAPQQNGQQKLESIQKAQKTQTSLSGAGGSAGEGLTVEALANMSEDEFANVYQKLGKTKFRQMMGG